MWKQKNRLHSHNLKTSWDQELYMSNMYPPNSTIDWVDTDTPEDAINDRDLKYTFNEYGFRSDSFEERGDYNILVSGCSHTVAVGVDQEEGWPFVLRKMMEDHSGKKVGMWNLATSGASPDYVVRSIIKTSEILKPDVVFVFWPPSVRIELPSSEKVTTPQVTQSFVRNPEYPKLFVNDSWIDDYMFTKNLIMLNRYCLAEKIRYKSDKNYFNKVDGDFWSIPDSSGRDGLHPGPEWHKNLASYFFNFIKDKMDQPHGQIQNN